MRSGRKYSMLAYEPVATNTHALLTLAFNQSVWTLRVNFFTTPRLTPTSRQCGGPPGRPLPDQLQPGRSRTILDGQTTHGAGHPPA